MTNDRTPKKQQSISAFAEETHRHLMKPPGLGRLKLTDQVYCRFGQAVERRSAVHVQHDLRLLARPN